MLVHVAGSQYSVFRSHSHSREYSCSCRSPSSVAGSSRTGSGKHLSGLGSRSPSRMSSRHGSGSPGCSSRHLHSCLHSPSHHADMDRQEEQPLLEFGNVFTQMQSVNRLLEALSEGRKIHGFHAGFDDNEQPASSYWLPIRNASADILADIDDRISATITDMRSKKVSMLLPYPGILCRHFYQFEGE